MSEQRDGIEVVHDEAERLDAELRDCRQALRENPNLTALGKVFDERDQALEQVKVLTEALATCHRRSHADHEIGESLLCHACAAILREHEEASRA